MKKICFLLFICVITANITKAQDSWVTHKGDDRVSLKFPNEPKEVIPGTFASSDDDSVAYIFTIVDFVKVANVDSATLAPIIATPEFAAQLKIGMKQSLPDVTLDDFVIGTWNGHTSYTTAGTDSKQKKYKIFMFIMGSKLYSASTVSPSNVNSKGNDIFVNSIMLNN